MLYIADDDDALADVAFLGLKAGQAQLPAPIPLASGIPLDPGRSVAVIGYPAYDYDETDRARMIEPFSGLRRQASVSR